MTFGFPELAAIRLGYGLSPLMPPPKDAAAVLAAVDTAGPGPEAVTTDKAREMSLRLADLTKARKDGGEAEKLEYQVYNRELSRMLVRDLQRRMVRAVDDPVGFGERLVQFWADHFTVAPMSSGNQPLAMAFVDEAIRPHVNGRFEDMFFAADTHPMMLLYLNQNSSRGPNSPFAKRRPEKDFGLNENLAREAMELHSLGVGAPYTQDDVRQLAELLTGLGYTSREGFTFKPQMAEPGAETVLGKSYGGQRRGGLQDIQAAFRDIARRPETAQFVSRKLAVHFISDDPSDALVQAMAATWRDTGGDLPQVYRVMVTHADLASDMRKKVRQPFDLLVSGYRALGITGDDLMALDFPQLPSQTFDTMNRMGQPWSRQTGPDGWPEHADAWIAPQMLAARINWSLQMPSRMLKRQLPDPREFLQTALGGTHSEQLAWAVPKAESEVEGVALVLASTDFNRR
ncbi:DUF1800 domain-containing protein [Paracoccus laeviglucosivorans]|uniref:Uncharacterized conserved protein, DUF1800 family n=1 Tax=Paracoccus laeviglucosivorans TaxID=1197861 RepID=A0A521AC14_9RHOB|nr:DUF1800 domain-containing protein [Paracoccus laeviglucosivorans]SMO32357.1 Uncharacterized conserved protein, DUF1800 family [Paracoccus laeviglucosivorans]